MKARYWGFSCLTLWILMFWLAYISNKLYADGSLIIVIIFTFLIMSLYPVIMWFFETDIGRIEELEVEVTDLRKQLKKRNKR